VLTREQAEELKAYVDRMVDGGLTGAECRGVFVLNVRPAAPPEAPADESPYEVSTGYVANDGRVGVEVWVVSPDGTVTDSQDFG